MDIALAKKYSGVQSCIKMVYLCQREPFKEEDFEEAIYEVISAEKKYDPSIIGYQWDKDNLRIQLEPIGTRDI